MILGPGCKIKENSDHIFRFEKGIILSSWETKIKLHVLVRFSYQGQLGDILGNMQGYFTVILNNILA